jgi:hypothetical protein
MAKSVNKSTWGVVVGWSAIWLVLAFLLEQLREGFVVNFINTKWLVVILIVSSFAYLISIPSKKLKNDID